ncbi:MAG: ABC-type cobalamin/Fe3+-siderophores transport system ATPase subunit [Candidatus Deianiraeaceae bacterium]|jgi:ABC-type cobalamin/Fe3+-siderophores transport system ATPase subunit
MEIQYQQFSLQNFKGIVRKVLIDISENSNAPYCFVGNNECGKTTILEGVELIGRVCQGYVLQDGELNKTRKTGAVFSETIQLTATIKCNNIPQNIYEYDRISKNEGIIL